MVNWYPIIPIITILVVVESKASQKWQSTADAGQGGENNMDNHLCNYTPNETNMRMEKSTIWMKMYLLSKNDKCPLPTILLFWRVTFRDVLGQSQVLGGFHGTFIFQTSKWPTDFQVAGSCSFQGGWNKKPPKKRQEMEGFNHQILGQVDGATTQQWPHGSHVFFWKMMTPWIHSSKHPSPGKGSQAFSPEK